MTSSGYNQLVKYVYIPPNKCRMSKYPGLGRGARTDIKDDMKVAFDVANKKKGEGRVVYTFIHKYTFCPVAQIYLQI